MENLLLAFETDILVHVEACKKELEANAKHPNKAALTRARKHLNALKSRITPFKTKTMS